MEAQGPPSVALSLASSGSGERQIGADGGGPKEREGSPLIRLSLGIDARSGIPTPAVHKQSNSLFTPAQLLELDQQAILLRYFVSGLPVPFHLVLPIWISVARSFGSTDGGIYNRYPCSVGFRLGIDYKDMEEPGPRRCQRTDGKKWRCHRNVDPDQKYCERHVHRGRQRSRKHVEASGISKSDIRTSINSRSTIAVNSHNTDNDNITLTILAPAVPELTNSFSNSSNNVMATTTAIPSFTSDGGKSDNFVAVNCSCSAANSTILVSAKKESCNVNYSATDAATPFAMEMATNSFTNSSFERNSNHGSHNFHGGGSKDAGCNYKSDRHSINKHNNDVKNRNFSSPSTPGLGFSGPSVIQDGTVLGCTSMVRKYKNVGIDPQRCRRTDGKRWRCSRNVLPSQKYCEQHMHRGSKKLLAASDLVTVASTAPPLAIPKYAISRTSLNTSLSLPMAENRQQMTCHEKTSASASSSDATTITDENASISP